MVSDFYQHPELYDALLPMKAHLPFYLELAREHPGDVLELACGTGQLIVPIAAGGSRTWGLDRSAAMLAGARRRAESAGVSIDLVEGDMSAFELNRRFAFIFITRNSLLHLASVDDVLRPLLLSGGTWRQAVSLPSTCSTQTSKYSRGQRAKSFPS